MNKIIIQFNFDNEKMLREIHIVDNSSDLPSNSDTVKSLFIAGLKSMLNEPEGIAVQDLLNEIHVKRS